MDNIEKIEKYLVKNFDQHEIFEERSNQRSISFESNNLKEVSSYPNLIAELQKRGYSTRDIQKILGENFARVWREVEEYARNS